MSDSDQEDTFIPDRKLDIALYKVRMCNFIIRKGFCDLGKKCKFAHSENEKRRIFDPVPVWVKKMYNMKPIYQEHKNRYFDDPDDDFKPAFLNDAKSECQENREMQFEKDFAESKANDDSDRREFINPKSKDFNSFQMRGNPLAPKLTNLEREFTNLTLECKNYKTKLNQAQATIDDLKVENQTLKENTHIKSEGNGETQPQNEGKGEILDYVLKQIDEFTKSPINGEQIESAVLTPSLAIIDKRDLSYIHYDRSSSYMKPSSTLNFINLRKIAQSKLDRLQDPTKDEVEVAEKQEPPQPEIKVIEKQVIKIEDASPKNSSLIDELKDLTEENDRLAQENMDLKKSIMELKKKVERSEADYLKLNKNYRAKANQCRTFEENISTLVHKVDKELECPILLAPMQTPTITPSGNTVDESIMDDLISSKKADPFDSKSLCDKKIINRLAINIRNIINEYR